MPFKPGQSGNPNGRPRATRNRITEAFLRDLDAEWRRSGEAALTKLAKDHPDKFCHLAASLLPKQIEVERPLEDLADDELAAAIAELRQRLATAQDTGAGAGGANSQEQAGDVPAIH